MPTREQMIADLKAVDQIGAMAGRPGAVVNPTREQMIRDLVTKDRQEAEDNQDARSGLEVGIEKMTTAARSGLEGMTLGLSEPVIGAVNAGLGHTINAVQDAKDIPDFADKFLDAGRLKDAYQEDVKERRRMKEENPYTDIGAQIGGALLPAVATLGQSALVSAGRMAPTVGKAATIGKALDVGGNVARGVSKAVGALPGAARATQIASPVGRGAAAIGRAAIEGAGTGLASEAIRQGTLKSTGYMEPGEGPSLADAAETGAAWSAGFAAIPQAWKASKYLGKRGMSVMLGPRVETIDKYMAAADRINKAASVEEIKDEIDMISRRLDDDVEKGTITLDEAKEFRKNIEERVRQLRQESSLEFSRRKFSAENEAREAQRNYKARVDAIQNQLKSQTPPEYVAGDIQTALRDGKKMIGDLSKESYKILENHDGLIDFYGPWKSLDDEIEKLNIKGKARTGPDIATQNELIKIKDLMGGLPTQVDGVTAKKIVQAIDRMGKKVGQYGSADFDDELSKALKSLRRQFDEQLKEVPGYAKKMEEVSQLMDVHQSLVDRTGDWRSTVGLIQSLPGPKGKEDLQKLQALASATGKDFVPVLDDYVKAQALLKNDQALEQMFAQTPEFQEMQRAEALKRSLQNPDAPVDFIEGQVKAAGLVDEQTRAQQQLEQAQQGLDAAQARREPYRNLSPQTSQAKIEALMREKDPIETRRMLEKFDEEFGTNILDKIEDRRILDTFQKGNTNGSRNVNLFSIMGHSFGAATGGLAGIGAATLGPVGLFAGAATGAIVDKFGPQMAKGILDAILRIEGNPSIKKIQSLNLPPEVKNFISGQFVKHQGEVIRGGGYPRAAEYQGEDERRRRYSSPAVNELDADSSRSSIYDPSQQAPNVRDEDDARQRFIKGN